MKEMQEIASPSVAMNIHTGVIETAEGEEASALQAWGEEVSALQTSANFSPHHAGHKAVLGAKGKLPDMATDMKRLGTLVQGMRTASSQLMQCKGSKTQRNLSAAMLEASVSLQPAKHFWTKAMVNKKCPGQPMGSLDTGDKPILPCKKKCE